MLVKKANDYRRSIVISAGIANASENSGELVLEDLLKHVMEHTGNVFEPKDIEELLSVEREMNEKSGDHFDIFLPFSEINKACKELKIHGELNFNSFRQSF